MSREASGSRNSSARSVNSSTRSRSAACSSGSSSERWIFADWIAAPSIGGWIGPEKIIGPPAVRTLRHISAFGNTIAPPAAANDLFSEQVATTRGCPPRASSAGPRPCLPAQPTPCESSM